MDNIFIHLFVFFFYYNDDLHGSTEILVKIGYFMTEEIRANPGVR